MIFEYTLSLNDKIRRAVTQQHLTNQLQKIKLRKPKQESPFTMQSQFRRLENKKWTEIFQENQKIHQNLTNVKSVLNITSDLSDFQKIAKLNTQNKTNNILPKLQPRCNSLQRV
ncbi:unnamed protein product (macronuclear) [Paramecium tetraurelia]|uniref:Uncharacterized protein n=1 Tax=Paramecium tetraurelia TaxID=5888 RepID=A0EGS6_PARTE|nr:uncharacterized protein GSPATT00026841001 [Paramecium tetraurelia]CAK94517.1 unnamed protein product [Paramecium tetraurelia]|eukprot:XP_001461890.1 hypothetical protein (macronuclear) [Paramecium tetraurelia strain d4-2]